MKEYEAFDTVQILDYTRNTKMQEPIHLMLGFASALLAQRGKVWGILPEKAVCAPSLIGAPNHSVQPDTQNCNNNSTMPNHEWTDAVRDDTHKSSSIGKDLDAAAIVYTPFVALPDNRERLVVTD